MRVLSLILFSGLFFFSAGAAFAEEDPPAPSWLSVHEFDERRAFDVFGPPTRENAQWAEEQTALYDDMIAYYDDVAEDEDDFAFVAEAFSVSLEELRPSTLRIAEDDVDDVFADDPLPGQMRSTSYYVDRIRVPTLPGFALKPRSLEDVKLGEAEKHSLFAVEEKPKPEKKTEEKEEEKPKKEAKKPKEVLPPSVAAQRPQEAQVVPAVAGPSLAVPPQTPSAEALAGQINKPAMQPRPYNPDEETLLLLQQAVRELGLEKELNFETPLLGPQNLVQVKDGKPSEKGKEKITEKGAGAPAVKPEEKKVEELKVPAAVEAKKETGAASAPEQKPSEAQAQTNVKQETAPLPTAAQAPPPTSTEQPPPPKKKRRPKPVPPPVPEEDADGARTLDGEG